jgi:hypothetical protein
MERALCKPSGAQNFEVAPTVLEYLWSTDLYLIPVRFGVIMLVNIKITSLRNMRM